MPTVTVINVDRVVVVNGEALNFDFELDSKIWAIQWNGTSGHIEYIGDRVQNKTIKSIKQFQYLIDAFNTEKARLEAAAEQARLEAEAEQARLEAEAQEAEQTPAE